MHGVGRLAPEVLQRARLVLGTLRKTLSIKLEEYAAPLIARETRDPFKVLIVTILSQSCTDKSALRAFRNLETRIGVTPVNLARANVPRIESAIRTAGLQKQKARAIKQLSLRLLAECDGDLTRILRLPFDEARFRLTRLPKVGPKTADVVLLTEGRKTISVDTHVERVSKRLGFAPRKAGYEVTRKTLMSLFDDSEVRDVPRYFMALGRQICKAPKPRCPICPVESLCTFKRKTRSL